MAVQIVTVSLTAQSAQSFTFTKPLGNYAKTPGLTITVGGGATPFWRAADTDNGDGTMTGHLELTGAVTGTVEVQIWDKP